MSFARRFSISRARWKANRDAETPLAAVGWRVRAGNAMMRYASAIAGCLLMLGGCSVKVGDRVVDVFGGARPASPSASQPARTPPPPPVSLSPPPPIPAPAPLPGMEEDAQPEPLPTDSEPEVPPSGLAGVPGFISADRAEFRPCLEPNPRCSPMAALRFNDEVRVLRLDQEDWLFVRVLRLNQEGYVLRTQVAPIRQIRPAARPAPVSSPDPPTSSGREPRGTGERKPSQGPKEELVK